MLMTAKLQKDQIYVFVLFNFIHVSTYISINTVYMADKIGGTGQFNNGGGPGLSDVKNIRAKCVRFHRAL